MMNYFQPDKGFIQGRAGLESSVLLEKTVDVVLTASSFMMEPPVGRLTTSIGKGEFFAAKTATDSAFQRMLKAGGAIDKGDLTKAGRALQKHGSRSGSVFPQATGNQAAMNQQGQGVLQEILSSQSQSIRPNRFGGRDIFDAGTGRGVRYDGNGNMMGFLEP